MTSGIASPLVTVLIPTHDHASTLDLAVTSVLNQTIDALDIVVIGDGVKDDTRDVMSSFRSESRIRFLDTPKSASRAELVRHMVLTEATTPFVCYTGDDDLLLPDHVESTVERLQGSDFTHPLPVYIERDGCLVTHPTDIANPDCLSWHLDPRRNAISLTGAGHRLDAYLQLPHGWREPPPDCHSDHYMWQQWFRQPAFRFSTGVRLTVLKFDASVRHDMTPIERRAELLAWIDRSGDTDFEGNLALDAATAFRLSSVQLRLEVDDLNDRGNSDRVAWAAQSELFQAELGGLAHEILTVRANAAIEREAADAKILDAEAKISEAEIGASDARDQAMKLQEDLDAVLATRTWRLHDRLARHAFFRMITRG